MAHVSVAIYTPMDVRDAAHWAIWLEGPNDNNVILQIGDDKEGDGYYVEKPVKKRPDRSSRLELAIRCGTIAATHTLDNIIAKVQELPVDNKSTTWNCQNWVMDGLNALQQQCGLTIAEDVEAQLLSKRENPPYVNKDAAK